MQKTYNDFATVKRIKELSKYVSGKDVLDVGCRENIMKKFLDLGINYYGLEAGVEKKRKDSFFKFLPDGITDPKIRLIFKEKKFDTIILGETLEHLTKPFEALENIKYLLKKGGRIVGSVPNGIGWRYFFFLEFIGDGMLDFNNPKWDGSQHFFTFNKFVLKALLIRAGFKVKFIKEWGLWIPHTKIFFPFNLRGSHLLFLAENI